MRAALAAAVAEDLPRPGGGSTTRRFRALHDLAHTDLELARLAEAHHDARAIASELGAVLHDGSLYAVWAAAGPEPLTMEAIDGGRRFRMRGVASWCTGAGIVDRALVTVRLGDNGMVVDVPVADGSAVPGSPVWTSPAFAATNTTSLRFDLDVGEDAVIGDADVYLRRPGFWHGAIGVAACWAGGASGLLEMHRRQWTREDPHALARLGSAFAWTVAMRAVLDGAAAEIDAAPDDYEAAQARARRVRHVIERSCTAVADDLAVGAGPAPLAFHDTILRRVQQLQLYIRQCHGDRDLEPLGRHLLDSR